MKSIKSLVILGACIMLGSGIVSLAEAKGPFPSPPGECVKVCAKTFSDCVRGTSAATEACVNACQSTTPPDPTCLQACGAASSGGNEACLIEFQECSELAC